MDLNQMAVNPASLTEGVWVALDSETAVLIAREGNPAYRKLLQKKLEPHRAALRHGTIDEKQADRIVAEVEAETILLGWKGVKLDGKELTYSIKQATDLLLDPRLIEFQEFVRQAAANIENFRSADEEKAAGN